MPVPITDRADPPEGAVAVILVTNDRRFLLQHRDDRPDIWEPNRWGLFGGAIEPGETPEVALARELVEELELKPALPPTYFTQIAWDYRFMGHATKLRYFYVAQITEAEISCAVLHEGQDMKLFTGPEILREPNITPYDVHALRMYIASQS